MPNSQVPVIDPNGQFGAVPENEFSDAQAQGYRKAVHVIHPKTGQLGVVPEDEFGEAQKQGFMPAPEEQARQSLQNIMPDIVHQGGMDLVVPHGSLDKTPAQKTEEAMMKKGGATTGDVAKLAAQKTIPDVLQTALGLAPSKENWPYFVPIYGQGKMVVGGAKQAYEGAKGMVEKGSISNPEDIQNLSGGLGQAILGGVGLKEGVGAVRAGAKSLLEPRTIQSGKDNLSAALSTPAGKGGVRATKMDTDIATATPHLAEIFRGDNAIDAKNGDAFTEAADKIHDYRMDRWQQAQGAMRARHENETLDTGPVAQRALAEVGPADDLVDPTQANRAREWAQSLDQPTTLGTGIDTVKRLNQAIPSLPPEAGPVGVRVRQAALEGMRQAVENHLQLAGEQGVHDENIAYGALGNIEGRLRERAPGIVSREAMNGPVPKWLHTYAFAHPGHGIALGVSTRLSQIFDPSAVDLLRKGTRKLAGTSLAAPPLPAAPQFTQTPGNFPPTGPVRGLLPPAGGSSGPQTQSGPGPWPIQLGPNTPRPLTGPEKQLPAQGETSPSQTALPHERVPSAADRVWGGSTVPPGPQFGAEAMTAKSGGAIPQPESSLQRVTGQPPSNTGLRVPPTTRPSIPPTAVGSKPSETIAPYLTGQHEFSLFSAENPGNEKLSLAENRIRTAQNLNELRKLGYSPQVIEGYEDGRGGINSIFVPGMTTDDALVFQNHMNRTQGYSKQGSIITKQGLVDVADRKVSPINFNETKFGIDATNERFHSVATGAGERLPFAFHVSGEPMPLKEPVELEHHSNAPLKTGDFLLGSKRGAINGELGRPAGSEATRLNKGDGAPPGSYFYEKGTRAEPQIAARKHTYVVKGERSIATLEDSPEFQDAFKAKLQEAKTNGSNDADAKDIALNAAENAVRNAGYDGYRSKAYPGNVFLFGDHQIFKPGEEPGEPELVPHPNMPPEFLPPAAEAATPPKPATKTSAVTSRRAESAPRPGASKTPGSPTRPSATPPTQARAGGKIAKPQSKPQARGKSA
jgi:hypothetical protein